MKNTDILAQIVEHKRKEVKERKSLFPTKLLEQSIYFDTRTVSLKKYLLREDKQGIIAEIKRRSPSQGAINPYVSVEKTSIGYMQAGASALSILTDQKYFEGKNEDLMTARKFNFCPILRKEFIVEEYQLLEAKSIGADAILLIAAVLSPAEIKKLSDFSHSLGLEVLMEVHNEEELRSNLHDSIDIIGVNNRNLKTFSVDINTSKALSPIIPNHYVKISESGIGDPYTVLGLREYGFQGFLMGQNFMQHSRPEKACAQFIETLSKLSAEKIKTQ